MHIDLFHMERTQCLYENEVEFNLSESGVRPLRLEEILAGEDVARFLALSLKYPEADGSEELRTHIGQFHGADFLIGEIDDVYRRHGYFFALRTMT